MIPFGRASHKFCHAHVHFIECICDTFRLDTLKNVEGVWDINVLYMEMHVKHVKLCEMFERHSLYLFYFDM